MTGTLKSSGEKGLLYPCYCTRSQLHSVNAPHLSDGTYVYPGTCRQLTDAQRAAMGRAPAWRLIVPDREWTVEDRIQGKFTMNLASDCGDMVVRRADGVYVYQLAVTVDDALFFAQNQICFFGIYILDYAF